MSKEFEWIRNFSKITQNQTQDFPNALGLEDDVCIIAPHPKGVIIASKDMICEDKHFFSSDPLELIFKKAIRTNISDITAKGAKAYGIMLGLAISEKYKDKGEVIQNALREECEFYELPLLGGDITSSDKLLISITIFGLCPKMPPMRKNAKVGDKIYVTGNLGLSAMGLSIRQGQGSYNKDYKKLALDAYLLPNPPYFMGQNLFPYMNASCDISDGLLQDLQHILNASKVGAKIFTDKIPLIEVFSDKELNLKLALTGGDDYQILFISSEKEESLKEISQRHNIKITAIGEVTNSGILELIPFINCNLKGYQHF